MAEKMMRELCITKGTLASRKLEDLLPGNTMETCSCFRYLPIVGRTPVAIRSLSSSVGLQKMIHYKPVQITIDAPGLAKVFIDLVARHNDLPDLIISD